MNIRIKRIPKQANRTMYESESYLDDRIGFRATVIEVDSRLNCCNVVSTTGNVYKGIPVMSYEWICGENENKNYVSGSRNLPPVGTSVFVLTPTKSIAGAFIIGSLYTLGDENLQTLWATDNTDREKKNNIREVVSPSGWNTTENYENGNLRFISTDKNIQIDVNSVEDSENDSKKEIFLKAWENEIHISEEGISITNKKDSVVNIEGKTTITTKDDIEIKSDKKILVDGDDSGGVVIAPELKKQLYFMTTRIDTIIQAIQTAAVAPTDGGATFKANMVAVLSALVNKENFSNIESQKFFHGTK